MKKAPSYEELADRLLDLWQDQLSSMADDQDLADLMRRQFKVASQAGQAAWGVSALALMQAAMRQTQEAQKASPSAGGERPADAGPSDSPTEHGAGGPQTPGAASHSAGGDDVAGLLRRIADRLDHIEGRLEELEQQSGGTGPGGLGVPLQSVPNSSAKSSS